MVVQHNLTAMNSNRLLGLTTASQAKSTEKLSSGYKINRAADDASGLAISEKMRKQIRGLTQASANAEDGISAVQTAEGALTEVHDMLQRMNELAVKASNETNSESDRNYIQSEVDALVTEIDRVATTTKFNEIYLLKGTNNTTANGVGKSTYTTSDGNMGSINNLGTIDADGKYTVEMGDEDSSVTSAANGNNTVSGSGVTIGLNTYVYSASANTDTSARVFNSIDEMLATIKKDLAENGAGEVTGGVGGDVMGLQVVTNEEYGTQSIVISTFADMNSGLSTSLHVGADSSSDNKIGLNIQAMSARTLGINGIRVDGTNDDNATTAIDTIASALKIVSSQRSELGSVQNRLEHTINNLDNIVENTTSAESAIRDTDMATEMVKYSNYNILAQAGQSMLAQANQSNQGVLSLLG